MAPPLGLILTSTPSLPALRDALTRARAAILKVVPAWGLPQAWTPATIAEAAHLAPTLIVRTSWGDPSYAGGIRAMPKAAMILDELAPWLRVRPDAIIELGNEPLIVNTPDETVAWDYVWHLGTAIDVCRSAFPQAKILGPAHMINHPVVLGGYADGVSRWLDIAAPALHRCDGLSLHAYTANQLRDGLGQLRRHVSATLPVYLTEFALNETLAPAERAKRYHELLAEAPVEAALLYHLDLLGGSDPVHHNPNYDLDDDTLAALGAAPAAPPDPDATHYPKATLKGFVMDVWQWRTVAAFRRHLARYPYKATAPWAKGATLHHTISPTAAQWRGVESMLGMARFYRDTRKWDRGPHLYIASGSPDPRQDGIWQLCPLNLPGVHAESFNRDRWGLEMAGNFDGVPAPPDTMALACGAIAALLDWGALPNTLNGHRDDPKTDKTCPGKQTDLAAVRRAVQALR